MIDFEEELKKFHPSLEVEDVEDAIYNQDVTDLADVLVKLVKESKVEEGSVRCFALIVDVCCRGSIFALEAALT